MSSLYLLADAARSLGDKIVQGLIVTVTGVVLVFLILAFLIFVCFLLKHFNELMNRWDSYMARVRARRAAVRKAKEAEREALNEKLAAVDASGSKEAYAIEPDKLKAESKRRFSETKAAIDAEFEKIAAIEKETRENIKAIKAEFKIKIAEGVKEAERGFGNAESPAERKNAVKAKKLLLIDERNSAVKAAAAEGKARIAALKGDGVDDETVAVITAVIAALTEAEAKRRNVNFVIKSIKKI